MEETIEIRDIINVLLKGKWIIAVTTIVCLLLVGIASWFIIPKEYESKAVIQVASNTQDTGIIANYVATEFTPQVFKQRVQNDFVLKTAFENENLNNKFSRENLSITNEPNTNLVELVYTSDTAQNAQKELQTIIEVTKNEMNQSVQNTLKNLESTYQTEADSLSKEIETYINQYNDIVLKNNLPEVLILQTILNSEIVLNITEEQTKALTNVSGELQNQLLQLQAHIETKSGEYRKVLANYQSVKTGLDSFRPEPFIRLIVIPTINEEPASPNKIMNLAIGLVLGVLFGIAIVFLRYFWKKAEVIK